MSSSKYRFRQLAKVSCAILLLCGTRGFGKVYDYAPQQVKDIWESGEKAKQALERIEKVEAQASQAQADAKQKLSELEAKAIQAQADAKRKIEAAQSATSAEIKKAALEARKQREELEGQQREMNLKLADLKVQFIQLDAAKEENNRTLQQSKAQLEALGRAGEELRMSGNALTERWNMVVGKFKILMLCFGLLALIPLLWRPVWRVCVVLALRHLAPQPRFIIATAEGLVPFDLPPAGKRGQIDQKGQEGPCIR